MKKTLSVILTLTLIVALLSGCSNKEKFGQSSNEILTYKKLDSDKTKIIVSYTGNIYIDDFSAEFERLNPDVQVVPIDITGGNNYINPVSERLKNGDTPDVMFFPSNLVPNDIIKDYFVNLSSNSVISNFQAEPLNDVAIDASIYTLPCPSDVVSMIYNKTLFDQYGWEFPTSFDEFVSLCDKITEDTDGEVEPWNPNAKYSNEFQLVMEAFLFEELFAGVDNRLWYDNIIVGEGNFSEHIEPLYDAMQTLIDHNILRSEHFSYSATQRTKNFLEGKIAMINGTANIYNSETYNFAFMPFPSTSGNLGYVCKSYNSLIGLPKKDNDKKTKNAIDRYIAFFSSVDGQKAFIGNTLKVSNVKNVGSTANNLMEPLQVAIDEGHQFSIMNFNSEIGEVNFSLNNDGLAMASGTKTKEECLAAITENPFSYDGTTVSDNSEVLAGAESNFTILDTSFYIADMYREKAQADIGLIENNIAYRGNLMKIYAGNLTANNVTVLLPRSFENGATLVKANMTGSQIIAALNDPLGKAEQTADCVYAYSGLKCKIAPWNLQGERILSVTLADGSALDMNKLYSVAFWKGTVFDKYITEITDTYKGTWQNLLTEKLKKDGKISPANDGRIELIWK